MNDPQSKLPPRKHAVTGQIPTATPRPGITLLEVILALAILAGAMVLIGELLRLGGRQATAASVLSEGQVICQSVLAQLDSGIIPFAPTSNLPVPQDFEWVYSIDIQPQALDGLSAVRVVAVRAEDKGRDPIMAELSCWMIDPAFVQQRIDAVAEAASQAGGQ